MNLQLHLPTAIWEGEQGIHVGNLEPKSVQDMVGAEAWGGWHKKHVHCSQKGKCKQQAKEQMKHLSHLSNVPPQGYYQKPIHFLFLSKTKLQELVLSLFLGFCFFFFSSLKHRKQNGQNVWGKVEKHFLVACQTLERSKQVKIIIIININKIHLRK